MTTMILDMADRRNQGGRETSMILLVAASILGGFAGLGLFWAMGIDWAWIGFMLGGSVSALAVGWRLAMKRRAPVDRPNAIEAVSHEGPLARP